MIKPLPKNGNSLVDAMDLDRLRAKQEAEREYQDFMADLLEDDEGGKE